MNDPIEILKEYYRQINKKFQTKTEEVIKIVFEIHEHFTIDKVMEKMGQTKISVKFIKDLLNDLVSSGLIRKIFFKEKVYFEQIYAHAHHDHLICTKCNKIIPFRDEIIESEQERIVKENQFELLSHSLMLIGICKDCLESSESLSAYEFQKEDKGIEQGEIIPLSMINAGETVKVIRIEGGKQIVHRLTSMGLKTGDLIEILSNNFHGPFLIKSNNTRIGIGHGMTHDIIVKRI